MKYIDDEFIKNLAELKKHHELKQFGFRLFFVNVTLAIYYQMIALDMGCLSTEMDNKTCFLQAFPYSHDSGKVLTLSTVHYSKETVEGRHVNLLGILCHEESSTMFQEVKVYRASDENVNFFYNNLLSILSLLREFTISADGRHSLSAGFIKEGMTVVCPTLLRPSYNVRKIASLLSDSSELSA